MSYPIEPEGEWVTPNMEGYRIACCTCGLVHKFEFRIVYENEQLFVQLRAWRDNRATGQIRRKMRKQGCVIEE